MRIDQEQIIALLVKLDDRLNAVPGELAAGQTKIKEWLAVELAELDTRNRSDNGKLIVNQSAALRVEMTGLAERLMGVVLQKRQEVVGLAEITPKLTELAHNAAAGHFKEYARRHREELPTIVRKEFAALPVITQPSELFSMAESFTGNWDKDRLYEKDEVFTFRGSSYLVLRACRGIVPTQQSQKGPDAYYGLIAAAGAPGPMGTPSGAAIGPASSTDNAAALFSGTTGQLLKNSVTIINPTTGAISGFTTGTGLTFHGGGTITGASGAITITGVSGVVTVTSSAGGAGLNLISAADVNAATFYFGSPGDAVGAFFDWNYTNDLFQLGTSKAGASVQIKSGNGTLALTLDASQNATFAGACIGSTQALSGPGAANVTTETTKVTTTGVADAITLANGVNGQVKTVMHDVDGGSFVLTPATRNNWASYTSTVAGESITMKYVTTRGWTVVGSYLGTIA